MNSFQSHMLYIFKLSIDSYQRYQPVQLIAINFFCICLIHILRENNNFQTSITSMHCKPYQSNLCPEFSHCIVFVTFTFLLIRNLYACVDRFHAFIVFQRISKSNQLFLPIQNNPTDSHLNSSHFLY